MSQDLPKPETRVLSTMNEDGTRRWLHPRPSQGGFQRARRNLAYVLILVFAAIPYIQIGGKPAILLNIPKREYTFFGFTFLPTDTLLLALFMVTLIVAVFLVTALFGRVWCGWMCPQTVYLEFVYRPFERLFDGQPGARHAGGKKRTPARTVLKYAVYLAISMFLTHTFLAYFVGIDNLVHWVQQSPFKHPVPFLIMAVITVAMMFDFSFFREQTCLVACPYGRFQSVMLDRNSLIVSYDPGRGEPRAKGRRKGDAFETRGDCIDCKMCVDTCPTGIDIRDGLQMECIACTQCIDACDNVMKKLGMAPGLIRMTSQARIDGEKGSLFRPRVITYPTFMLIVITLFGIVLAHKQSADVTLLRERGRPFIELSEGEITNQLRVKIKNRGQEAAVYSISVVDDPAVQLSSTSGENQPIPVGAGEFKTSPIMITVPRSSFTDGRYNVRLNITDGKDFSKELSYRLLGPFN